MKTQSNTRIPYRVLYRRLSQRIPFRTKVKFRIEDSVWIGHTVNISEGGIAIKANRAFPPGSKIVALLYMDDQDIEVMGIITWASPLPEILSTMALSTMGITLLSDVDKIKHISRQILEPYTTILS